MHQTQLGDEEVIISSVVWKEGDEMQESHYFSQAAESKCVSVTPRPGVLSVDQEGFGHGDTGESSPASLSLC